jgi:protein ImuA
VIEQLRHSLRTLEKPAGMEDAPGCLAFGIEAVDAVLGGGLARGALHEIAAPGEAHLTAAAGFVLGLAPREQARVFWIAEDMTLSESGAPYGPGLDTFALAPERLLTVGVAHRRDLLWAMEETLRCRAVAAVIGEWRHGATDMVAMRRLSLAAAASGALALLLRTTSVNDASTAVTRWIVGAASSVTMQGPGPPRFATHLVRNRRGPTASWILEWSDSNERFLLAPHAQPVAAPSRDRPHRKIA